MPTILYTFNRLEKGRYQAIEPTTGQTVGTVFGSSNDWRAHPVGSSEINNAYARKQDAAAACHNARHWARAAS